ncbi:hypothetical protein DACRYDRAFT_74322 [Dacryopinax primogenitus]|uniref:Peptide hydrolase n=1 Tax=Dacryopinax primogenitus (strain DJM 731) TaxID=1858805 RepID=M5G4J7_DACPD|nr:uncharacterized protein DACRYDRAFT_74322 [Dacryopinax primogenitus]EJU05176.1 hypothetical protein DACRYDRAFT_74322 [Dacryopinax primogenitus]
MRHPPTLVHLLLLFLPLLVKSQSQRALKHLTDGQLRTLAKPDAITQLDPKNANGHLAKVLIPRPPDTANNTLVRNYIVQHFRTLQWDVEEDTFRDNTPYGEKQFTNIIATKDKYAAGRLLLTAHFDSKFFPSFPQNQFVGATDSAAPCAILLDLVSVLNPYFPTPSNKPHSGTTLQVVFFDGEEAYKEWTATDSTYGSRHLAEKWSETYVQTPSAFVPAENVLSTIEHLVLLDLLGAASPLISSYFPDTAWLFDALVSSQTRLAEHGLLDTPELVGGDKNKGKWGDWDSFFVPRSNAIPWHIEDDHIPFLKRGVPILHVIASPFPRVWHTLSDDASALDLPTLKRWNLIFRVFTAEYLGLAIPEQGRHEELRA